MTDLALRSQPGWWKGFRHEVELARQKDIIVKCQRASCFWDWQNSRMPAWCVWEEGIGIGRGQVMPVLFFNVRAMIFLIWLSWLLVAKCGVLIATCGIFSCSIWALSLGMWDLLPWPGIKPWSSALGAWSLNYWTTREVWCQILYAVLKIGCRSSFSSGEETFLSEVFFCFTGSLLFWCISSFAVYM